MKTVWKYSIKYGEFDHDIPEGAKFLHMCAAPQTAMWFEVDTDAPKVKRTFRTYGTGHSVTAGTYVGTLVGEVIVLHVYEV